MSGILCKCGKAMSNSSNPEIQYIVFSDEEWISALDRIDQGERIHDFDGYEITFWKCPSCKRLYFWEYQNDHPLAIYKLEEKNGF